MGNLFCKFNACSVVHVYRDLVVGVPRVNLGDMDVKVVWSGSHFHWLPAC